MSKDTMTATGTVDFQSAVALLEDILSRMKQGRLVVGSGDDAVEITPSERVEIGIQVQDTDGIQGLSLDLRWNAGEEGLEKEEEPGLSAGQSSACGLSVVKKPAVRRG